MNDPKGTNNGALFDLREKHRNRIIKFGRDRISRQAKHSYPRRFSWIKNQGVCKIEIECDYCAFFYPANLEHFGILRSSHTLQVNRRDL
jgi:hypothetical protein